MKEPSECRPGVGDAGPPTWADLIDIDGLDRDDPAWRDEDLAAMLRHQLAATLRSALDVLDDASATRTLDGAPADETFERLLSRPDPPAALLDVVRRFGKTAMADSRSLVPHEVGAVLYYASIATARRRCGHRISGLSDEALTQGVETVLEWDWVRGLTRDLLESELAVLRSGPGEGPG